MAQTEQTEHPENVAEEEEVIVKPLVEPPFDTLEWIIYWGEIEGHLPTPINVSITGSVVYKCPLLEWFNFDVYPHKIKLTNTGYTLVLGAKWMAERPYIVGGPFLEKLIFFQIHFHWGADFLEGCEHTVDNQTHLGEMQATFFKADYMTQKEALHHKDGIVMFCYLIKYGVKPDPRLQHLIDVFPQIREAQTHTKVPPRPMSQLMPLFSEDYFLYWGTLDSIQGNHIMRFLIPRKPLFLSYEQILEFRNLWDPWDEPLLRNFRPLQERHDRHIFLINPHWNLYNSLLPIPRVPEESISKLSPVYLNSPWLLPPQNADLIPQHEVEEEEEHKEE